MNYGHFAGRLGRDAELRYTQDSKPVANFVLAVDTGWGDRKETLWIDCSLWGERAEKLQPHLVKGKQLTVSGDIGLRTFQKRDGSTGATITLNVQRLTLQGGGEQRPAAAPAPAAPPPQRPAPPPPSGGDPFNDDIPFAPYEHRSLA
jgi:single-strand DNA-binding protein